MAISVGSNGWSGPIKYIRKNDNPYTDDSYQTLSGTWFQRSWWGSYYWARKFVNSTNMNLKLTSISFLCCPGHSGGALYWGGSYLDDGTKNLLTSGGYGCVFNADVYILDSSGNKSNPIASMQVGVLQSINIANCSYGGELGKTTTTSTKTSFGSVKVCKNKYDETQNPRVPLWRREHVLTFTTPPVVPAGGALYLHVHPTSWTSGSNTSNSLMVIESKNDNFVPIIEPEEKDYIWRYNKPLGAWEKTRVAHICNDGKWIELRG